MVERRVPEFNIVALGPPSSGKTVYLAMLYQVISARSLAPGVNFSTGLADQGWLESVYAYMLSEQHPELSKKTRFGVREVQFRCTVEWTGRRSWFQRDLSHRFRALAINYIDYAGEQYREPQLSAFPDSSDDSSKLPGAFIKKLKEAHVLIGIIDGEELANYLDHPAGSPQFLRENVEYLVKTILDQESEDGRRGVPAHFVITKWDLLSSHGMEEIEKVLLRTNYADLIDNRSVEMQAVGAAGRIRLIPVSSVGGFVQRKPDGTPTKGHRPAPEPLNVEIPLLAAVVDACELAGDILRQQERRAKEQAKAERTARAAGTVSGAAVKPIRLAFGPASLEFDRIDIAAVTVSSGVALGSPAMRLGRAVRREFRRVLSRGRTGVRSEEGALFYVARAFRDRLAVFEEKQLAEREHVARDQQAGRHHQHAPGILAPPPRPGIAD